jgi:hypothetical protein
VALESTERDDLVGYPCADRIGFARLTTMAFGGTDLRPLRDQLMSKVAAGTAGAGEQLPAAQGERPRAKSGAERPGCHSPPGACRVLLGR